MLVDLVSVIADIKVLTDNVAEKSPSKKKRGRPAKAKTGTGDLEVLVFLGYKAVLYIFND